MATSAEQAATLARTFGTKEEQLKTKIAASPSPNAEIAALLNELRDVCEQTIFTNIEYAAAHKIEERLWDAHSRVRARHRALMSACQKDRKQGKNKAVETRVLAQQYYEFVKFSTNHYRSYVQHLDSNFDGIPELRAVAQNWKKGVSPGTRRRSTSPAQHRLIVQSCYSTLIHLGDLARYRCEPEIVATLKKKADWAHAVGYYGFATQFYPDSGISFNQLAVVSMAQSDHFRATYFLYRSLSVKEPHPMARQNLELGFKKVLSAWKKGELINNRKRDSKSYGAALIAWFLRLHSSCYKGEEFPERKDLENEVVSQLKNELKEHEVETLLHKIILINMGAGHHASNAVQARQTEETFLAYFYFLRLNIKTFLSLLELLIQELEKSAGEDVASSTQDQNDELTAKLSPIMRRILPSLRLYSSWFFNNWKFLTPAIDRSLSNADVDDLWSAYAKSLSRLASAFPATQLTQLPQERYLLDEEIDTVGFMPLISDKTRDLWYQNEGKGALFPKHHEIGNRRLAVDMEMVMRIRDILIHGLKFTQDAETPLDLDSSGFVYKNATEVLPNLHTSPRQQPDPSQVPPMNVSSTTPAQRKRSSSRPQRQTKPPRAESSSASYSKEAALTRMVDDLVGPDEAEDDNRDDNFPRTPPSHTFEDTAMVNDNTYGLAPQTADELVYMVQNYAKTSRPSSSSPFLANPGMASSPVIRHIPSIPSLPDQSNIWKNDFAGSSNPASPYPPGLHPGTSPMAHPSGMHSRGPSMSSNRSSGQYPENAWSSFNPTPVGASHNTQPLGNGTFGASGNYADIYGNGNGTSGTVNRTMGSPFLFGAGSTAWGPPLSANTQTPPNGQGSPSLGLGMNRSLSNRGGFAMGRTNSNGHWG